MRDVMCPAVATARLDRDGGMHRVTSDHTPIVTPTPLYAYPLSGCLERGFCMSWTGGRAAIAADCRSVASATGVRISPCPPFEMTLDEYRRKADRTSPVMAGPMGEAAAMSAPSQVRVLTPANPTTRASEQEACTHGAGSSSKAFPLLRLICRANRRTAPRVNIEDA